MKLIEVIAKGDIITLSPANSEGTEGEVLVSWFEDNFNDLSISTVPLSEGKYNQLKAIDDYWKINAERWRNEGLI